MKLVSIALLLLALPACDMKRQIEENQAEINHWYQFCKDHHGRVVRGGKGGDDMCFSPDGRLIGTK